MIHRYLSTSYWSEGVSKQAVINAMKHSFCFAVVSEGKQIAFGRFISDMTRFAYLADVFVLDSFQGQGIGKRMIADALALPEIKDLKRIMLTTSTASGLYQKFGFTELKEPEQMMEKWR